MTVDELKASGLTDGLRIALRIEGNEWVAYVASTKTMEGAPRFASIRMAAITSEASRQAWVDAMTKIGSDMIEEMTGQNVLSVEIKHGPESEKAGRA